MNVMLWGERGIGAFKYALAILMIVSGIFTAVAPLEPLSGPLGLIYSSRLILVILGIWFSGSGLTLLIGKIIRSKRLVGLGLMSIYLCFVFAAILNAMSWGVWTAWIGNAVMAFITGLLWLRWKFKTTYINPKHFRQEIKELR